MSQTFRWSLLWIGGALLGVVAALTMLSSSYVDGQFGPAHADAFYHAARVLDALFSGQPVIQFDPKIHVPEGSWLTWPWGFDQLLAWITQAFGPYQDRAGANRVLMNIPPAAMPIAIGLVVLIARQLALPLLLATPLVLGFAVLPAVFVQFAVGNIDHHFAEMTWTLATISSGLWFFREQQTSAWAGVVLGAVLGSAMAIHNGLFILQIPVAVMLGLSWVRGRPLPDLRRIAALSTSLLVTTLLVCLASTPWRRGFFEFYTLSWFHSYVAACVAIFAVLVSRLQRGGRNIAIVVVAATLALLPIIGTLPFAKDFLSGELASISAIIEAWSPYRIYFEYGADQSTRLLSWLMWLSAPFALLNAWWVATRREPQLQFVAVVGTLTLLLMQSQYRFCVFGVFSLLLTPVLAVKLLAEQYPKWRSALLAACYALLVISYYPTLSTWRTNWIPGGESTYAEIRKGFRWLAPMCEARPGIVLGGIELGHWVRYHTKCSVIADVFLLTRQHAEKAQEVGRLMQLTPRQLLDARPDVAYVFAYHTTQLGLDENGQEMPDLEQVRLTLPALERELLGPEARIPERFHKQWELRTPGGRAMARIYEIVPPP